MKDSSDFRRIYKIYANIFYRIKKCFSFIFLDCHDKPTACLAMTTSSLAVFVMAVPKAIHKDTNFYNKIQNPQKILRIINQICFGWNLVQISLQSILVIYDSLYRHCVHLQFVCIMPSQAHCL